VAGPPSRHTKICACARGPHGPKTEARKQGTVSSQKHELLFSHFNLNYNTLDDMFKRGTILLRPRAEKGAKAPAAILTLHEDLLQDQWWKDRAGVLPVP
jgi:tRNA(His) guanylyltransferase